MTNLKRQTVLTISNPIPSPDGIHEINHTSHEKQKTVVTLKPFRLLIDDKVVKLEDVGQITVPFLRPELLFKSYKFFCDENFCLFKTTQDEFLLLKTHSYGQFELFSIGKTFLFDSVYYLPTGKESAFRCQIAISYDVGQFGSTKIKTQLFYCDDHRIIKNSPSPHIGIVDVFGPFPILLNLEDSGCRQNPWWIALCEDSYYRVFYHNFKEKIDWVTDKSGNDVLAFKRFLPTFVPNSYYFLTKDNTELLVHALNGENQASFDSAMSGAFCKRVIPPKREPPLPATFFFLGIPQDFNGEKEDFPFSFNNFNWKKHIIS